MKLSVFGTWTDTHTHTSQNHPRYAGCNDIFTKFLCPHKSNNAMVLCAIVACNFCIQHPAIIAGFFGKRAIIGACCMQQLLMKAWHNRMLYFNRMLSAAVSPFINDVTSQLYHYNKTASTQSKFSIKCIFWIFFIF